MEIKVRELTDVQEKSVQESLTILKEKSQNKTQSLQRQR